MIRPLRRAHRWIVALLAIALPILIATAILLREEFPIQREWPYNAAATGTQQ